MSVGSCTRGAPAPSIAPDRRDDADRKLALDQKGALFDMELDVAADTAEVQQRFRAPQPVDVDAGLTHVFAECASCIDAMRLIENRHRQSAEEGTASNVLSAEPRALLCADGQYPNVSRGTSPAVLPGRRAGKSCQNACQTIVVTASWDGVKM